MIMPRAWHFCGANVFDHLLATAPKSDVKVVCARKLKNHAGIEIPLTYVNAPTKTFEIRPEWNYFRWLRIRLRLCGAIPR